MFDHIPSEEELLERYPHNVELVAYFLNRSISEGDQERIHELLEAVPADVAERDARCWRALAWCEDAIGDFESAEQSLRRAFQLDPYWWQIHFQLYDLLRRLGRQEESARFFEMYRISKALATEIKTLLQSTDELDDQRFCRPLLELARMVGDDEVAIALQERLAIP
jgi:tetratricopeptide (TPR) repeat protein